jgi:hypothetical protein
MPPPSVRGDGWTQVSTTQRVLEHHLDAFSNQNLDAVMEDYGDESTVVTNMGTYRGLDEIEGLFEELFADFAQDGSEIVMDQQEIEDDVAYIVWHGETPTNDYAFATDTFVVDQEDEVITTQTFAGRIEAKD